MGLYVHLYIYYRYKYKFCSRHCEFVEFQYGLNGTNKDRLTWNFHSNFDLISLTNLPNFNEIYFPKIAEIQVRKSGFLQTTQKTYNYNVRWQALSWDAFLVKDGDFKHEIWFHWTYPRALRARNSPGALASALISHWQLIIWKYNVWVFICVVFWIATMV